MRSLPVPRLVDVLDTASVSLILYVVIIWMRRARVRRAMFGLEAFSGAYFLAVQIGLRLTERIFQGFFAIIVIAVIIIFQPELRRLFERLAALGLGRVKHVNVPGEVSESLARVAFQLAELRCGAIVVVPGKDLLDRHLEGGIVLDGRLSIRCC